MEPSFNPLSLYSLGSHGYYWVVLFSPYERSWLALDTQLMLPAPCTMHYRHPCTPLSISLLGAQPITADLANDTPRSSARLPPTHYAHIHIVLRHVVNRSFFFNLGFRILPFTFSRCASVGLRYLTGWILRNRIHLGLVCPFP